MDIRDKIIAKIKAEIAALNDRIGEARDDYDYFDANHPHDQARIMKRIIELLRERDRLEIELKSWEGKK